MNEREITENSRLCVAYDAPEISEQESFEAACRKLTRVAVILDPSCKGNKDEDYIAKTCVIFHRPHHFSKHN